MGAEIVRVLLHLYPRGWRARYGEEVAELLVREAFTPRLVLDLIAGAVDARLTPQASATGGVMTESIFRCARVATTREDAWKSTSVILSGSLLSALIYMALRPRQMFGYPDLLLYGGFPISMVLASYWTTLKRYRPAARFALMGLESAVILAILLGSIWLADRM